MNIVAHNLQAMNSNRQLGMVSGAKSKSMEKLSSGYRINRSADDAAGLAISEKMRWQIRGLDKGSQNIGDGISLIQTAEGALNEVHSILQRVRELSVQALNDTNTESDRNKIQLEVEKSLEEIDHIRDTTMFNTKPLLQGNEYKDVKITPDTVTEYTYTMSLSIPKPSWITLDERMEVHSNYDYTSQDLNGIMLKAIKPDPSDPESGFTGIYYGADRGDVDYKGITYKHIPSSNGGDWTPSIKNNPSAKVDFSHLKDYSKPDDLKENLRNILGVNLSFPCGTCYSEVNSVQFIGSWDNFYASADRSIYSTDHKCLVNLNNAKIEYDFGKGVEEYTYFDAVDKLIEKYSVNYDNDNSNDISGEEDETKTIADKIAKGLRDLAYDALKKSTEVLSSHYERVLKPNDDPYSLIMYDYRDTDKVGLYTPSNLKISTSGSAQITVPAQAIQEGVIIPVEQKLNIMCGALRTSYIGLDLPDMSLSELGLDGYRVDYYSKTVNTYYDMNKEQLDAYEKAMKEWEASAHDVSYTGQHTVKEFESYDPGTPAKYQTIFDDNGEEKSYMISAGTPPVIKYKTKTEDYYYTVTEHDGPMPQPPQNTMRQTVTSTYTPSSLWLVDEAIDKVSRARAMLGSQQNRLEYTYNINNNTSENTSAAESRIRDTDMAEEMVNYSKHNILEQAGSSVLAQANQAQQGILSLVAG